MNYLDSIFAPALRKENGGISRINVGDLLGVISYAGGAYSNAVTTLSGYRFPVSTYMSRNGRFVAVMYRRANEGDPDSHDSSTAYIDVIDTQSWEVISTIHETSDPSWIAVSDVGVIVVSLINTARVYDAVAGEDLATIGGEGNELVTANITYGGGTPLRVVEFSPDGMHLLCGRYSFGIGVYRTSDWQLDPTITLPGFYIPEVDDDPDAFRDSVCWLNFSPDGDVLYYLTTDAGLNALAWPSGDPVAVPTVTPLISPSGGDIGFHPDGKRLFFNPGTSYGESLVVRCVQLDDPDATPEVVYSDPNFMGIESVGINFSPDGSRMLLSGSLHSSQNDSTVAPSYATVIGIKVLDIATWETELTYRWAFGAYVYGVRNFAVWLPSTSLGVMTGVVTDDTGAPVERDVLVIPRNPESHLPPAWSRSGPDGRYRIPLAMSGELLSRIVFDSTGEFNDLIDKVRV